MPTYRHTAGFGKRIEFWLIGQMLKEGLDVYIPVVDDNGIDVVVRRKDGSFIEVQLKARSKDIDPKYAALFAGMHPELRESYWFVFYSEWIQKKWIMSSAEFIAESCKNQSGKNIGKRTICLGGIRQDRTSGIREPYVTKRFDRFVSMDFSRLTTLSPRNHVQSSSILLGESAGMVAAATHLRTR